MQPHPNRTVRYPSTAGQEDANRMSIGVPAAFSGMIALMAKTSCLPTIRSDGYPLGENTLVPGHATRYGSQPAFSRRQARGFSRCLDFGCWPARFFCWARPLSAVVNGAGIASGVESLFPVPAVTPIHTLPLPRSARRDRTAALQIRTTPASRRCRVARHAQPRPDPPPGPA